MNVYWAHRAKTRLRAIHTYIAQDSVFAADKTISKILQRSAQISALPYSGNAVPEYRDERIREVSTQPYRIIYIVRQDRIDILTVMHFRQLLPSDLIINP